VQESNVPLELCLTSNVKTESVPGYKEHHMRQFLEAGHPICLCTDDSGVFQTTLTDEFVHVASTFSLQGVLLCSQSLAACYVVLVHGIAEFCLSSLASLGVCEQSVMRNGMRGCRTGKELVNIVEQSIAAAFVEEHVKDVLRARLQEHVSLSDH
jgi:hypothetical protein